MRAHSYQVSRQLLTVAEARLLACANSVRHRQSSPKKVSGPMKPKPRLLYWKKGSRKEQDGGERRETEIAWHTKHYHNWLFYMIGQRK